MSHRVRTRPYAVLAALALAVSPLVVAATPAAAATPGSVTLVGSLQSEFGCAGDWDPACSATHLTRSGTTWTGTWTLPAGSYEFKVAINDAWTENYGAGGAPGGANIPIGWLAVAIGTSCAVLLVVGRYRLVETASMLMVGAFTLSTLIAVGFLQFTPYAVTGAQLASGLSFHLPADLATAFGAFGIIGVGASELIYYPYWCLEKGYARKLGPDDGTAAWRERAKGWLKVMRVDAWMSFALYTTTTVAFYLLGAAILHAKKLTVQNQQMIEVLSFMYRETFGEWSLWLFLLGAIAVLYSTIFGGTASNARLLADALSLFGIKQYRNDEERVRWVKACCVLLPVAFTSVFLVFGNPVKLVFWGAVAQGLMLPFLAGAALYFHFTSPHRDLRARPLSLVFLVIAALLMTALGAYQVVTEVSRWLS